MKLTKGEGSLSDLISAPNHSKTALFLGVNLQSEQASWQIKAQRSLFPNTNAIKMHRGS